MPASTQHSQYKEFLPRWELVRDCVEGAPAIKSRARKLGPDVTLDSWKRPLPGTRYLPQPRPYDTSAENRSRYFSYLERALFVGYTAMTKEGLMGLAFRNEPIINLPVSLEYLRSNADGGGTSLTQFIREVMGEVIETGRVGLLADYPEAPAGMTQAETEALGLVSRISIYPAEAIINWRWELVGTQRQLTLVVLREEVQEDVDGFDVEVKPRYRVLRLEDGVYYQELYDEHDTLVPIQTEDGLVNRLVPRKSDGTTWSAIPFQFIGSQNNDPMPDKSVLYDIAEANVSHYQNRADLQESSFMVGQPTPWASGLDQNWVDEVLKGGFEVGSRALIPLPENGQAGLLQASPNQLPHQVMKETENEMIRIGARLIEDSSGRETAEAARIRYGGQNSKLAGLIGNVEQAFINVIGWVGQFMGVAETPVLKMNRQFYDNSIDPQEVIAQIQLLDRGVIAESDVRDSLRKTGWVEYNRTDEQIDEEVGRSDPLA